MLALPQRSQHMPHRHHRLSTTTQTPSSTSTSSHPPSPLSPHTYTLSQQQSAHQKLLNDYLDSQQTSFNPALAIIDANSSNPFMTGLYDFANPQIRIQQSTPTPQMTASFSPSSMLSTQAASSGLQNWNASYNTSNNSNGQGSQSLQTPQQSRAARNHQRASSQSSIGSGYQTAFSNVSNHLPTPTHTPTQDSFMNHSNSNNFSSYSTTQTPGMDSAMAAHMSMKQALMDQHGPDEEAPGFAHSARHSVSSYGHDSPATPHTAQGEEADFKMPASGETLHKVDSWLFNQFLTYDDDTDMRNMLHRTYTDVAADYAFDPNTVVAQTQSIPQKSTANTLLSPYRTGNPNDIVQRSLQAAQNARSQSPSSSVSRSNSPFRRDSPYRQPTSSFRSPRMAVGTAAAAREQNAEADAAYAMKSQRSQAGDDAQVKTISPKDALLDYREADDESKVPLFPEGGASEYDHQYNGGDQYRNATQSTFDTTSQSFQRDNSWATPQFSPNFSTSVTGASQPPTTFAFATPAIQAASIQGIPFSSTSQYRAVPQQMSSSTDQNPEFPAHLTSMESSCSEMEPSSQSSDRVQKPADSKADSGTYTCTYHGCTQRFETPQKLQKHKREGHRNAANIGMGSSSSMTSAALLERNSQAGPHKCERINPTTGKPCNTIFSRPYDLTRHEDTIHNVRKQKVRCALCVEEKTFSRNDALTRHMRVVHPEVDFPGKHRRRGGNHD